MFDDGWRGGTRGSAPLRVILGCVLLSTGAWGQSADAGRTDAGGLGPTGVPDAGQTVLGGLGADGGQAASAAPGPVGAPDAGPSDAARVEVTLHGVPVTVTASSVLADAKAPGRYGLANLLDEDPGSIWAEGAKGSGVGEWVELSFPPDTPVHSFLVTPGNPKSAKLYKANARPRKAKLELKLAEGRKLDYVLDFPRDFPAGGAIYVDYQRQFAVKSARLTVLTVWPGSRYRDLCLGGFVPVFRGPPDRSMETFLGTGNELAPTLALFMRSPSLVFELLPPETSGVPAWLRSYSRVPHSGPLPLPEEEFNMHHVTSGWSRYRRQLAENVAGASLQSELFRFILAPGGKNYVLDPIAPPKGPDSFSNFRVYWAQVEGGWHVVGVDVPYREQTADD
ncbi:NADase-type glycan-binding domain-containing protein [Pyxidicoccus xibeiensis]|uniref:NADase-type glycan-binding domain-containing protein n=1 Tax=Pyxidicoccus xibeiensis TaxID=2906759 RepID=UPI0020A7A3FE|nr:hypothetical protein [Pyxidicoccus xibeiensis]MCP3136403.1 hypothetical protein [Pyxidicoccus xibeiensis]